MGTSITTTPKKCKVSLATINLLHSQQAGLHKKLVLAAEQDKVLSTYGVKLEETAKHIVGAIREATIKLQDQETGSDRAAQTMLETKGKTKLEEISSFIDRDIKHAQAEFHKLAATRAEHEHHR
eukprot:SAG11_NODE_2189_length_3707_cov_2.141075_5_plen_124_part_00